MQISLSTRLYLSTNNVFYHQLSIKNHVLMLILTYLLKHKGKMRNVINCDLDTMTQISFI